MRPTALAAGGLAVALCAGVLLSVGGCGWGDGSLEPVDQPSLAPAEPGAGGSGGGTGSVARRRTVGVRSPFGAHPGNLLLDGDFEFSAVSGANLPGWMPIRWSSGGIVDLELETGGLCRSGMRCAIAERGVAFLGWGTAARGFGMAASIWAKVPAGRACDVVEPVVTQCWYVTGTQLLPVVAEPDADGWCRYEARLYPQETAACMYVETTLESGELALLDEAVIVPSTGAAPMSANRAPLRPDQRQRIQAALDLARARRPFGRPSDPAQRFNRD